jgi:hypothetical protein
LGRKDRKVFDKMTEEEGQRWELVRIRCGLNIHFLLKSLFSVDLWINGSTLRRTRLFLNFNMVSALKWTVQRDGFLAGSGSS